MNYRPSRNFVYLMVVFCPLLVALIFGLLPEVPSFAARPIPGEITFSSPKPTLKAPLRIATRSTSMHISGWLEEGYENLMKWEYNPWKIQQNTFGDHYFKLLDSKNPADRARAKELQRLGDAQFQKLLARYPELAPPLKNVPDDRNGFLKWLEFSERFNADPKRPGVSSGKALEFPEALRKHLSGDGPWNAEAVKTWLSQEKPLMDEIRAIGLMPEQSVNGIAINRWGFMPARLAKGCTEALLLEARLAAAEGDVSSALESVQAASGLATHFGNVESPSLLAVTVQILVQLQVQKYTVSEIMPALPAGQLDSDAWENAIHPTVSKPAEFARILKGEWAVTTRYFLLPMLLDAEDPKSPSDPEALLDYHAALFLDTVRDVEGLSLKDFLEKPLGNAPDNSHLSRTSRQTTESLLIGMKAWNKGWARAQSATAITQAGFAIMGGQPIPKIRFTAKTTNGTPPPASFPCPPEKSSTR
jgi:hypothetical protein